VLFLDADVRVTPEALRWAWRGGNLATDSL
jgi:hypothetical protein